MNVHKSTTILMGVCLCLRLLGKVLTATQGRIVQATLMLCRRLDGAIGLLGDIKEWMSSRSERGNYLTGMVGDEDKKLVFANDIGSARVSTSKNLSMKG